VTFSVQEVVVNMENMVVTRSLQLYQRWTCDIRLHR